MGDDIYPAAAQAKWTAEHLCGICPGKWAAIIEEAYALLYAEHGAMKAVVDAVRTRQPGRALVLVQNLDAAGGG